MNTSLKFWLKIVLIVIFFGFIYTYVYKEVRKISQPSKVSPISTETPTIEVNFLGIDKPQQVFIEKSGDGAKIKLKKDGKLLDEVNYPRDTFGQLANPEIVKFNDRSNKEYLVWTDSVGPHQYEVTVMAANEEQITMLYAADFEQKTWYAPFWVSRGNKVLIKDINNDGLKEIVEFTDEYPVNAPRLNDSEVEKITREVFSENEIGKEKTDQMWKIVRRENNGLGRGFRVAWSIYSFVDSEKPYFKKLNNQEYEEMVKILLKDSPAYHGKSKFSMNPKDGLFTLDPEVDLSDTISRSQLSKDSIEFNEFVRKFWAGGYYNEPFGEHIPEL